MSDLLLPIGDGSSFKRFKDMGDGTVAEVISVAGGGGGLPPQVSALMANANIIIPAGADYTRIKAKKLQQAAGTRDVTTMHLTSSEGAGFRAKSPTSNTGCRVSCFAQIMANNLNCNATPAIAANWFGDSNAAQGTSGNFNLFDPRVATIGAGAVSVQPTIGGYMLRTFNNNDGISTQFLEPVNSFRIWMLGDTGTGSFALSRTGDAASGTISSVRGSETLISFTFTGALNNNPLVFAQVGAGTCFVVGIEAWDSTRSQVRCASAAWIGGSSLDRSNTASPTKYLNAVLAMAPDLVFLDEDGINDGRTGGANILPADHRINLEKQITTLLPVSDIVLSTGFPYQVTVGTLALQKQYRQNIIDMSAKYKLWCIDIFNKNISWELQVALGYSQTDGLHQTTAGYDLWGKVKAGVYLSL